MVGLVLVAALCVLAWVPAAAPAGAPAIVCTLGPGEEALARPEVRHGLAQPPAPSTPTSRSRPWRRHRAAERLLARVRDCDPALPRRQAAAAQGASTPTSQARTGRRRRRLAARRAPSLERRPAHPRPEPARGADLRDRAGAQAGPRRRDVQRPARCARADAGGADRALALPRRLRREGRQARARTPPNGGCPRDRG